MLVHCVLSSPTSMQPYARRFLRTLCFHLLTSFMEMLISISSRTLAPARSAKTTSKWFSYQDITVLYWPANMPNLIPICNLWDIFKRKMINSQSKNTDEITGSIMPQQCHRLIASMPHLTDAGICAKGAPTKY